MKKRVITLVSIVALLMTYSAALAAPVTASTIYVSGPYQHNMMITPLASAIVKYTFYTCTDWLHERHEDQLEVNIDVLCSAAATKAVANAKVDRQYYYWFFGWRYRWVNVFNESLTALWNQHLSDTWVEWIPYSIEYKLTSNLKAYDINGEHSTPGCLSIVTPYRIPIISALLTEDFEWGNDGTRLEYWEDHGGDVDWTVTMGGGGWWRIGVVDIDDTAVDPTAHAHTGTRSARFYRDYSYLVASYPQDSPAYRSFYFYFEDDNDDNDANNAKLSTFTGDGENTIYVRVYPSGDDLFVKYYDGSWHSNTVECPTDEWHILEFKNIDWGAATYDIYVDGVPVFDASGMAKIPIYNGKTAFFNNGGAQSTFWIDNIC